ncbi:cytochrome P450 [Microlunatus speluncae]|uniref:cytochrome P450 n=1 Tax=Microlunatus speluncae TaxID=2594267 RepID=UPI0012666AAC|nr:cytochrome P450 [Microlunatus speluncae]
MTGCPVRFGGTDYQQVEDPAAVREVFGRVADFPPANALTAAQPLSRAALDVLAGAGVSLPPVLASASGELHARTRRVVARFFSPGRSAATEPAIVARTIAATERIRAGLGAGPVDLATELSRQVPAAVLGELIGVTLPPPEVLQPWSRDSLELFWGAPDGDRQLQLAHSVATFYRWLHAQVLACEGPADGLFGALRAAGLSLRQRCSLGFFLIIAGQETTVQLINIGLLRAITRTGCWAELADRDRAGHFVRRLLATESSVPAWRRIAGQDGTIAGRPVVRGTELLLRLTGDDHGLAFGYGVHRCLGATLAELETTLVLHTAARELPGLELAGPEPDWIRLLCFQTPRTVLVRAG